MEVLGVVVFMIGIYALFGGLGMMISADDGPKFPWAGVSVFLGGFVMLGLAGWLIVSSGETYEEERDRIFEETYSQCMDDYASGKTEVYTGKGAASDVTYVCEGEAWRALERWRNE